MTPYAELHCHSNFSFLDGASHPEQLVAEAVRLGICAMALTDHDGLYGVVRFAEAARLAGLRSAFGAELTLAPRGAGKKGSGKKAERTGAPDPAGEHLEVIARDPDGYSRLSRAIAEAHLAGKEKGLPLTGLDDLAGRHDGHWLVLTGCRKGSVPAALTASGPAAASHALRTLVEAFGPENVAVELWDHGDPLDTARNDALAHLAVTAGLPIVATNNVHYATPAERPLATVLGAVRGAGHCPTSSGGLHLRRPPTCAREQSRHAGSPAGRERSRPPPSSVSRAPSTCASLLPGSPTSPSPAATPSRAGWRSSCARARSPATAGEVPSASRARGLSSTTSSASSWSSGTPATSSSCGTSSSSAGVTTSTARGVGPPPTLRCASPSASPALTR